MTCHGTGMQARNMVTRSFPPLPIRVLAVDDHPVLREGIAAMLEAEAGFALAGQAENGEQAIAMFRVLRPDVTLMDLQMPGMNGIDTIRAIRSEHPNARIIVLTTYDGDVQAAAALRVGAAGFLLKSAVRRELFDAIRTVHAGRRTVMTEMAQELAIHGGAEALSERELAVLRHVAAGARNKEIAWDLGISEDTVKAHLKNVFLKLAAKDRTHAVTIAIRRGFLTI